MKEKILHADPSYLDRLKGFTRTDTLITAGYYMLILIVYYIMGRVLAKTGTYYGVFVNIAFILIPVFICRGLYALGLCRNNLCRSLIVSGITGIAFLLAVTIIPGTLSVSLASGVYSTVPSVRQHLRKHTSARLRGHEYGHFLLKKGLSEESWISLMQKSA